MVTDDKEQPVESHRLFELVSGNRCCNEIMPVLLWV